MANDSINGGITPFGAEQKAADAATAAATSTDALTTFLESGALLLAAALVVSLFLIYQFGRWFLTGPSVREAMPGEAGAAPGRAPAPRAAPEMAPGSGSGMASDGEGDDDRQRISRPWQVRQ